MEPAGPVTWRNMFGGAGVFCDGLMFALVAGDQLYFKADAESAPDFEALECEPFRYQTKGGKEGRMPYYEAPDGVFDDPDEFLRWMQKAVGAASRAKSK